MEWYHWWLGFVALAIIGGVIALIIIYPEAGWPVLGVVGGAACFAVTGYAIACWAID